MGEFSRRQMASRGGVTDDKVREIRSIVGPGPSDMDIIRALYQSKNDVSSALNIIFDTPSWLSQAFNTTPGKRKAGSRSSTGSTENSKPASQNSKAVPANVEPKVAMIESSSKPVTPSTRAVPLQEGKGAATSQVAPKVAWQEIEELNAQSLRKTGENELRISTSRQISTPGDKKPDIQEVRRPNEGQEKAALNQNPRPPHVIPAELDTRPKASSSSVRLTPPSVHHNHVCDGIVSVPRRANTRYVPSSEDVLGTSQVDSHLGINRQLPGVDKCEDRLCSEGVNSLDDSTHAHSFIDLTCTDPTIWQTSRIAASSTASFFSKSSRKAPTKPLKVSHEDFLANTAYLRDHNSLYTEPLLRLQASWQEDLLFLGRAEVTCLSTCRGSKLFVGEELEFNFPKRYTADEQSLAEGRRGWGRPNKAAADIIRFSTSKAGEIGRLPAELAKSLIPLFSSKKVAISARCSDVPVSLNLLDSIILDLGIFVCRSLFKKYDGTPAISISVSADASTHNPLLQVLRLLKKEPVKKAEFTPEDLYSRKRSLDLDVTEKGTAELTLPPEKRLKLSSGAGAPGVPGNSEEVGDEGQISDADLNKIVGTSDGSELMEMEPPSIITCELRPYQKQALCWMYRMEAGHDIEEAAMTLHPCWEAYHLGDRVTLFYVNVFSGDATMDFPSALQTSRGGILADAMGLGKTVMTIAMLATAPDRGGMLPVDLDLPPKIESEEDVDLAEAPFEDDTTPPHTRPQAFKIGSRTPTGKLRGGGTLIVCPMTLLGQWKTEIENHMKPGVFSVHSYYGNDRVQDTKLLKYDVVLTTYGVLASDSINKHDVLQNIHWSRIVLDEAHTIKGLRTQGAQAAFKLTADRRWCLTGTPIQNKLEDVFSLLHFLRIEPWGNFGWWTKLIQKPFDEGEPRGLNLLQAVLKPLMLRRTKDTIDKFGRPILVLPTIDVQVIQCQLTEVERDFYEALFRKSKVKFDEFVEQGKVLHNYASILELLLRLRQCCDHPYLVLSRGDTDEFSDLNKLAKHFMDGSRPGEGPSKAYVEEVVNDFRKGNKAECPVCLEAAEDAVLTPCAHCLCRECLFASWRSYGGGACPVCRQNMKRQDVITAPKKSKFSIDVKENWKESSKVTALMLQLEATRNSGEKSVVFSQWTSFLDLLHIPLEKEKFKFVRLDGSLSQLQREQVIKDFSCDPKIVVMLISLKAGGVGVNLTAASHAFLMDPWWNPAVEEQAIMRIHRIGQTKNVTVRRFICTDTVEERMQLVQARKQRMIAGALNNEEVRAARLEELKMLFR